MSVTRAENILIQVCGHYDYQYALLTISFRSLPIEKLLGWAKYFDICVN